MDPNTVQRPHDTTGGGGGTGPSSSNSSPSVIWIIIPLVVVLLTGALIAISYRVVTRCRRRKAGDGDAEGGAMGPGTTVSGGGEDVMIGGGLVPPQGARHYTTPESDTLQPTDRWGWVFDPNSSRSNTSRGAARISEGLNELGEAPPPYGVDNERPKSYVAEMTEVGDSGEGASGLVLGQERGPLEEISGHRRPGSGSEPPAYELAMGAGETSSIREPPPAVTPPPR
ncbi:hypothetical protein VMCG_07705 [Cytospora schulzeri]|uniref:Uncharacterized protein n=1 Tax=Cytospora schulzeri TaxID=448051 RepID=A0A423VZ11_9PEZI|nr:hypothetical protein VMCG_07705 [Valsa malicola]